MLSCMDEKKPDATTEKKSDAAPADDPAALKAKIAAYEARETQRAADAVKAAEEAKAKAKADGDLKTQLELQAKELEALKALQGDAELGKSFREREEKRVAEGRTKLTAEQAAFLDAQPNIALKAQALDLFLKSTSTTETKKTGDAQKGGAPAGDDVDYAAALRDPMKWAELKKRDPEGTAKFIRAQMDGSRPGNTKPLAFLH
jgi:hypothetical protein